MSTKRASCASPSRPVARNGGAGTAVYTTTTAGVTGTIGSKGGLLLATLPIDKNSSGNLVGALFTHGRVISANLPANNGVDADFKRLAGSRIEWI